MVEALLVVGIVATGLLLVMSAFFSSSETAIFTVPTEWGESRADAGDSRGRALDRLQEDPHRLLVTLLVGNNVVNIAISSIITVLVVQNLPPGPAVLATTLLSSALILIFGEIVPKSYGLGNAEEWSLTVAPVVTLVEKLLSPIISVFDWVTRAINERISGEIDIERPYVE